MTELLYLLCFFVFSMLQSMMINGIHLSMEGKDKLNKEGDWYGVGDILYGIKREFSTATRDKDFLAYGATKKALSKGSLRAPRPYPEMEIISNGGFEIIAYKKNTPEGSLVIAALQDLMINHGIKYCLAREVINVYEPEGMEYLLLWTESFKYKYPEYIRKSIGGGCIKCMASFYGVITFVPAFLAFYGHRIVMYPLIFANIFVLVFLNYFLYKQ